MTAWYLKIDAAPPAAVLVGDRGRVLVAARLLDEARLLNEDRGLTTVVGCWRGAELVVSAFGMGAPIAAIVMHELAALGTTTFVRAGTTMTRQPPLGTFVVADRALIHEGTSLAYGSTADAVDLDRPMADALVAACPDLPVVRGTVATCDGFYTQMTDLLGRVPEVPARWDAERVIALDMETSALATVADALGVRFGSLCVATVAVEGPVMLDAPAREAAEARLLVAAFDATTAVAASPPLEAHQQPSRQRGVRP